MSSANSNAYVSILCADDGVVFVAVTSSFPGVIAFAVTVILSTLSLVLFVNVSFVISSSVTTYSYVIFLLSPASKSSDSVNWFSSSYFAINVL